MSTNPNNAVGTNAAYGGRTSVNARNDILSAWNGRGIISGWSVAPSSGMSVEAGGVSGVRDVAIVEDASGNKTTVNNISGSPISVTLEAAPTTNSRIDAIVIYVDNPPQGEPMVIDNPQPCGIIAVTGTPDSTPTAPNDSAIRAAITADGAAGVNAYYVVIANITVGSGVTDITSDVIQATVAANVNVSMLLNNPKFMQTGNKPVWAYHSNSSGGLETITFNTPFDNIPIVLTTGIAFSVFGVVVNTSSISKTGFSISARHTHDSGDPISVNAHWVAIDITQLCITSK